jgi:hypothetical protein
MAGGHSLDLPVKHSRGTYAQSYDGSVAYYVIFYCPTGSPNSPARYSGFSINQTNTPSSTYSIASITTASNTIASVYSGDFNVFSESGFIYAG